MLQLIQQLLTAVVATASLSQSIEPYTPHLSSRARLELAADLVGAGEETGIDPYLLAAVMWHESDFQNVPGNETHDYGVMQVHWQPGERWLAGLRPDDLMIVRTNVYAGARELAHLRMFCQSHDAGGHYWWSHYKYGIVVPSVRYGEAIWGRLQILKHRPHPAT